MAVAKSFLDLIVYRAARDGAQRIFEVSKGFPKDERFSLTDQVRRSSRAVGAMIAEAWGRRRYVKVYVSKLDEALGKANETQAWVDHAKMHGYIDGSEFDELMDHYQILGGRLNRMMDRAADFSKNAPDTDYRSIVSEDDSNEVHSTTHHSPFTIH